MGVSNPIEKMKMNIWDSSFWGFMGTSNTQTSPQWLLKGILYNPEPPTVLDTCFLLAPQESC